MLSDFSDRNLNEFIDTLFERLDKIEQRLGNLEQASIFIPDSGLDPRAIHDNVSNEIEALTEKQSPDIDDIVIIEDSENDYSKKKVKLLNIGGGGSSTRTLLYDSDDESISWPVTSIDITGISPSFTDLEMQIDLQTDGVSSYDTRNYIYFNGDTTHANYQTSLFVFGSASIMLVESEPRMINATISGGGSDRYSSSLIRIPLYTGSHYKNIFVQAFLHETNAPFTYGLIHHGEWINTDTIDQITIVPYTGGTQFVVGSRVRLWGST